MSSLLSRLIEAGTPADLVAEVAMTLARAQIAEEAIEARRARDRGRQQEKREKDRHVTSRDIADVTAPIDPQKEIPPHPHKKNNTNPPSLAGGPPLPVQQAVDCWNELAGEIALPRISKLTEKRRKLIRARLAEHGLDGWQNVLARIRGSPFLRGENGRGWIVDFDFAAGEAGFLKIIEGKYDGRIGQSNSSPAAGRYAAAFALIADGKSEGAGEDEGDHWGAGAEVPRLGWN